MSEPFIGEIRAFGFNFAPIGWAQCNGQLLAIAPNTALFAVIGTTYGGDGSQTFGVPNLQGRVPMHWGSVTGLPPTQIGQAQGEAQVTLTAAQIPQHTHVAIAVRPGNKSERTDTPSAAAFLGSSAAPTGIYQLAPTVSAAFAPNAISITGGSLPHENMQPYLVLNFCIALDGIFPQHP